MPKLILHVKGVFLIVLVENAVWDPRIVGQKSWRGVGVYDESNILLEISKLSSGEKYAVFWFIYLQEIYILQNS